MDFNGGSSSCNTATATQSELEADMDLRRGPWTVEEDLLLMNYIASHGEGRWNSLARCAGLKRTGKSCRLRWLNYLRPDVRRGNITLEEQLMILELHSRWGNRWSKIAQHLPGRTDNEIKNYWRTRVQKHAKQLQCDVNSKQFKDTMKYLWMPRLVERIQAAASASSAGSTITSHHQSFNGGFHDHQGSTSNLSDAQINSNHSSIFFNTNHNPEISSREEASSDCSDQGTQISTVSDYNNTSCTTTTNLLVNDSTTNSNNMYNTQNAHYNYPDTLISPTGYFNQASGMEFQGSVDQQLQQSNGMWLGGDGAEGISDNLWNVEDDMWF